MDHSPLLPLTSPRSGSAPTARWGHTMEGYDTVALAKAKPAVLLVENFPPSQRGYPGWEVTNKTWYLKVKIDGLPIRKGRLVKGPYIINQYVGTVPSIFQLL